MKSSLSVVPMLVPRIGMYFICKFACDERFQVLGTLLMTLKLCGVLLSWHFLHRDPSTSKDGRGLGALYQ
jgi:hypothetical protein